MKNGCGGTTIIGFKTQNALWFIYTEREDSQEEKTAFINYSLFSHTKEKGGFDSTTTTTTKSITRRIRKKMGLPAAFSIKHKDTVWLICTCKGDREEAMTAFANYVLEVAEEEENAKRKIRRGSSSQFRSEGTITSASKPVGGIVLGADTRSVQRSSGKLTTNAADKLFFLSNGIGVLVGSGTSRFLKVVREAVDENIVAELSNRNLDTLRSKDICRIIKAELNIQEKLWDPKDQLVQGSFILAMYDYSEEGLPIPILVKFKIRRGEKATYSEYKSVVHGGCYNPPSPNYLERNCIDGTSIEDHVCIHDIFICLGKRDAEKKVACLPRDAGIGGHTMICVIQPKGLGRSVYLPKPYTLVKQDFFGGAFRFKVDLGKMKSLKQPPVKYPKHMKDWEGHIVDIQLARNS